MTGTRTHTRGMRPFLLVLALFTFGACTPKVKTVLPDGVELVEHGVLDVTNAFPGAGNYSGYDSTVLPTNKVCSDKSIFGIAGTAVCQGTAGGTTAIAAQVLTGTYFWDALGISTAGTMANRGSSWDLTTAFPGVGYYSGVTSAVTAASVCSSTSILGSAGTAVCLSGTATDAAAVGNVLTGKEYWDSTGTKRTGTMANQSNTWDLTTAFPGVGYYSGISSAVAASDVCNTKNFLGAAGTAVCNSIVSDLTYSQAYRADNATIDLMNAVAVAARTRATLADEAAGNATYTTNHLLVPNPMYDTDGEDDDTGIGTAKRNYLETVKGRPTVVCGLSGTTDTRITDCATRNTTKATWEGAYYGQAGEGDWKLVTLYKAAAAAGDACAGGSASGCYEVWRDERTKLIWSDYLNNNGNGYNWFRAAGYSSSATTTAVTGAEGRAGVGTDCFDVSSNAEVCQPATPISVCAHATTIANLNGVATYQNPDGTGGTYDEGPAKGNLTATTVGWRLPTHADWATAIANGMNKVLPTMLESTVYWTATSYSADRARAWLAGGSGLLFPGVRDTVYAVRCVGH